MRRVFSRSDLRKQALERHDIAHSDPTRPRVTKWSWCGSCGVIEPRYLMQVDHQTPVIPVEGALEDMTWDEVVDRLWCSLDGLLPLCKPCHKQKTKEENKARRLYKKGK